MKSLLTTFFLSLSLLNSSFAQTADLKKLDSLFDELQNRGLATGSVAVLIDGKIEYQRAIGFTRLDNNKAIQPDVNTQYRIGSVSKLFTAVLIFQLIDEKKLTLEDKLSTFFPQLPSSNRISIQDMLYHRSGLYDYTRETNFSEWMDKRKSQEDMLKMIEELGADFEPGTKADYCNTNYLLLSYILERLTGMTYAEALKQRITSKIALKYTYYGRPINSSSNEAASYKYAESRWIKEKETDLSIHSGAGSIVSTPGDLTLFIHQLFSGNLISRASMDSMKRIIDGYGMGIFPFDFETTPGYGHNGRIEEFYAAVRYYPQKKLAVSYITNGILYPRMDILDGVLSICFNRPYTIPFSIREDLQKLDLDKYVGTYSGGLPFKVTCKKENGNLVFDVTGKTMIAEPVSTNYFMNLATGSFFQFKPEIGELQIKETDNVYYLKKEQ
jgi:D-alanyl-D-alanine carboxypeptidase